MFENNFKNNYNSIISELFYGINQIKYKCKGCNNIKYNYVIFYYIEFRLDYINMFLGKNKNGIMVSNINIYECFKYYQREQFIDRNSKQYCDKCNDKYGFYYYLNLYSIPNYLIIILNRDHGNTYRCKIVFNEILDLTDFGIVKEESGIFYDLYAIICHIGPDENSGHFFAYCRNIINNKWYLYNDSIVTESEFKNIKGMPYILFYQKVTFI